MEMTSWLWKHRVVALVCFSPQPSVERSWADTLPVGDHEERQFWMICLSHHSSSCFFSLYLHSPWCSQQSVWIWRGRRAGHGLCTTQPGYVVNASRLGTHCVSAGSREGLVCWFASCLRKEKTVNAECCWWAHSGLSPQMHRNSVVLTVTGNYKSCL